MGKRIIIISIAALVLLIVGIGGCFVCLDFWKKDTTETAQNALQESDLKTNKEIPARDQIENKYKWNLADMYASDEEWGRDFRKIEIEYLPKFSGYQGKLADTRELLDCLNLQDQMYLILAKMNVYSCYKQSEDLTNAQASEMYSKVSTLNSKADAAVAFIDPELIALPAESLEVLMKKYDFRDYSHYFDVLIRKKEHVLSGPEEKLLAASGDMAGSFVNIYNKATAADIQFPTIKDPQGQDIQISEARYSSFMMSEDRDFRRRSAEGLMSAYGNMKNTLAESLNGQVKSNIFFAQARKYNNALESALSENFIPEAVYNNLIETTDKNLEYLHKYVSLRKNVFGLDQVHGYDMYVPLVKNIDQKIPYENGKEIVLASLSPLGSEYSDILKQGLENRWVDVYENKSKESGASAWAAYGYHPYVKMNYDDSFDGVSALVHEFGHAVNFWYANKNQPFAISDTPIFNAEVASTANQLLLMKYMINKAASDDEKLYYLDQLAGLIYKTFYTQTMFSEFEKSIHDRVEGGEALSVDSLNQLWGDVLVKYYGPDYVLDDFSKIGWSRIPHFYYNFYLYKYATSISAANQLVKNIFDQKPGAQEKYIKFLSAGSSDYPVDLLKNAGIDMTMSDPIENLVKDFGTIVDEMELIIKKES
ncbi:MAG: oligoendopeptidase F [Candidatus Paceibacterota bacterium]|jgi:oligoendopeptidase F